MSKALSIDNGIHTVSINVGKLIKEKNSFCVELNYKQGTDAETMSTNKIMCMNVAVRIDRVESKLKLASYQ